jgi:hypothetical protein
MAFKTMGQFRSRPLPPLTYGAPQRKFRASCAEGCGSQDGWVSTLMPVGRCLRVQRSVSHFEEVTQRSMGQEI